MRRLIAVLFTMFLAEATLAQPPSRGDAATIAFASSYLSAYQALDLARLEAHYAESAVFNDPTSQRIPGIGGPFVWQGREKIMTGLREWKKSISSLRYDVDEVYEASGHVVFIGVVNPVVSGPSGTKHYRYRIVSVITVDGGRVLEHRDYTDYAGATVTAGSAR